MDISGILDKYYLSPSICGLFPKIDLQRLIALALSLPPTPGATSAFFYAVERTSGEHFKIVDMTELENFLIDVWSYVDIQLKFPGIDETQAPPLFKGWLGDQSVILGYHHDTNEYQKLQQQSKQAVESYLSTPIESTW